MDAATTKDSKRGPSASSVLKVIVSLALVLGAAAYLLGGSLRSSLVYDRTVDQVVEEAEALAGQQVRVGGKLAAGTLQPMGPSKGYEFALTGEEERLLVRYEGLWPDAATDGRELMIEGAVAEDGSVTADRVLARCPSRYKRRVSGEQGEAPSEPTAPAP